jgi:hypothetical protein
MTPKIEDGVLLQTTSPRAVRVGVEELPEPLSPFD